MSSGDRMKEILAGICILAVCLWKKAELRTLFDSVPDDTKIIIGVAFLLVIVVGYPILVFYRMKPKTM